MILADCAAGTGCPVIASLQGSDFAVAVAEPSESSLSDIKKALDVAEHFGIPCAMIINKCGLNPPVLRKIKKFAEKEGIPVLAEIPHDRRFLKSAVEMRPAVFYGKDIESIFDDIAGKVLRSFQ